MSDRISFDCPHCQARLRAPVRVVGRAGPCPHCGKRVVVPATPPAEAGPLLVDDDSPPQGRQPAWRI